MRYFLEGENPKLGEKCKKCNGTYYVCLAKYKKTGTIHIFCCRPSNEGCICIPKCLCNCIERTGAQPKDFEIVESCIPLEEARIRAAELQNNGENVCGDCVSALYYNDL